MHIDRTQRLAVCLLVQGALPLPAYAGGLPAGTAAAADAEPCKVTPPPTKNKGILPADAPQTNGLTVRESGADALQQTAEPASDTVAQVEIEGEAEPQYFADIAAAFAAVGAGDTATITLLADATVPDGQKLTVTGTVVLEGGEHTISGAYYNTADGLISVNGGCLTIQSDTVTIRNTGPGVVHGVHVADGGKLVVNGGTIQARAQGSGNYAYGVTVDAGGTVEINGGTIIGENQDTGSNGCGIMASSSSSVKISAGTIKGAFIGLNVTTSDVSLTGGTFTGGSYAIDCGSDGLNIGSLLAEGYVYYEGEKTEGTPAHGVSTTGATLPAGTFTVGKCVNHDWREGNYTCTYCNAQAAASVKIGEETTYYGAIGDAWAAAKKQTTGATVTLLADVSVSETLTVEDGDDITLKSDLKNDGSEYTLSCSGDGRGAQIVISGGKLKLESGNVTYSAVSANCLKIEGGQFTMTGGSLYAYLRAIQATGGKVYIFGGRINAYTGAGVALLMTGDDSDAVLEGGTFSGWRAVQVQGNTQGKTVGMLLSDGCAYKQGNTWVNDAAEKTSLSGTITVEPAPIRSVTVTGANTEVTYGYTEAEAPTLTATATLAADYEGTPVTYQWYQDGEKIEDATGSTYTLGSLNAGDYAYTCTVTATDEGYSRTSKAVTITVQPANISGAVVTVGGTYTYTGSAQEPTDITVTLDGVKLTADDYDIKSYENNTNASTDEAPATVAVTGKGNYTGEAAGTFVIVKSRPTVEFNNYPTTATYSGQALADPTEAQMAITGAAYGDVKFTWSASPVNAGTYTLTASIPATDNTEMATASTTVTIQPKPLSNPTITLSPSSYEYDGTAKEPKVTVLDGETEINSSEYTVSYSNNVNVGTAATVTITDATGGNYEVSGSTTFEITKPDLATATVTLALTDGTPVTDSTYTYDGQPKEPEVTVVKNGVPVDEDEYTVSYSNTNGGDGNHTNAGTVTVTITATGSGNYSGSKSKTFEIKQADISGAVVTLSGTRFEYIGGTEIAVQSVALNGVDLKYGTDYTYSGNIGKDAGTYTVKVEGKGNYTGTATADWEIYQRELTVGNWTITKAYDGTADITLDTSDAVLYDVRYQDDVKLDASGVTAKFEDADAGDSKAITYIGTFTLTGTAAKNYVLKYQPTLTGSITQRPITVTPTAGQSKEYGTAGPVALTYTTGEGQLLDGHTVTIARSDKSEAVGQYDIDTCTITDAAQKDVTANYDVTLEEATFEITKPSLSTATVTLSQTSFTYTGQPQAPTVTVTKGTATVADTEYTVRYTGKDGTSYDSADAPMNAGAYAVIVTAVQDGSYTGSNAEASFTIAQASLADAVVTPVAELVYSGEAQEQKVNVTVGDQTLEAGKDYTLSDNIGTDAGSYTLRVTAKEGGNYTGSKDAAFTIAKAKVAVYFVSTTDRTYEQGNRNVDVSVTWNNGSNDPDVIKRTVTAVMDDDSAGENKKVTVTVTVTDPNYQLYTMDAEPIESWTGTTTVDIAKAAQAALSITGLPADDIRYDDTFTLTAEGGSGTGAVTWAITSGEQYAQIDPATGTVEITGVGSVTIAATKSGDTNYTDATATVTFTTKAKAQEALTITGLPDAETLVYGRETFPLSTAGGSGTGAVTWAVTSGNTAASVDENGNVTVTGAGKVTVTATKAADGNYDAATAEITFTIGKAPASDAPDYELPSGLTATYGEALSDVELPTGWSWMDDTELVGDAGKQEHSARFTPTDTDNYKIAENISLTVQVQRAAGPAAPTVTVRYTPGADGQTFVCTVEATLSALPNAALEYRMDDGDWQASPVFEGIAPESEHTFAARAAVTANYEAGQAGEYSQTFTPLEREADDIPPLAVSVSGESASRTVTIEPVEGAEYSFDGGLTWSADNTLTGIDSAEIETVTVGIRYAETVTLLASAANTREVSTTKEAHAAPETMKLDFAIAPDGTHYSASLPAVDGLLYSADGVNYKAPAEGAATVTLYEDCEPGQKYTAYIKYAETDEFAESASTRVTGTAPAWSVEKPIEQEDVDELDIILRLNPDELTEVPAGLQAQYDTPEQLESELISRVTTQLLPSSGAGAPDAPSLAGTAVYDVTLEFSLDDGKTWIEATEKNFPEDGLTVALECPAVDGDPADYQFAVVHIFTVDMNDHKAGDVETPVVTYNAEQNTLTFTVHGLSPVAVGWTLRDQPAQPEQSGSDGDVEAFIGAAVVIGGGAALLAYHYREDLPIWKLAGVVTLAAADGTAAATPVADASVTLYQDGEAVKTLTTDESGLFTARVPKGTYEAVVTWERDGAVYTARKEVVAESVLDDGAVQQIVLQAAQPQT